MVAPERKKHIEEDIKARSEEAWGYQFPVRNQNYVVLSIVEASDDPNPNPNPSAIKIFGVYGGLEEANRVSAEISKENDFFNVYVADTNAWVPIPPTRDFIENVEYQEEKITQIKNSFAALKERNARNIASSLKKEMVEEKDG
ncbi:unnamed protein product, partial [Sphacelaria rigidula]